MYFLEIPLRNYLLHESSVSEVFCEQSKIWFIFDCGFWNNNHEKLEECKIMINILHLDINNTDRFFNAQEHGIINKKISFSAFLKKLKKEHFVIDVDYYSEFERSLLLIGRISNREFEIKITDIDNISFLHS